MAGNTVYVQGSYVDVHDNEVVNLSIDKATVSVQDTETYNSEVDKEIVNQLKPIFYGSEEEARAFLASIQGMKPTQITAKVNELVNDRKISALSKNRDLWTVLHDAGIYDKSESNWNMQVN